MNEEWLDQLSNAPPHIVDAFQKAQTVINLPQYEAGKILCSISGGADSDVMLDLLTKVDINHKIRYVFFNTGVEYRATLEHIDYLEKKYNIEIIRKRAVKPIPACVKEYGQPVFSKRISDYISRLQRHNFQWEDEPLDVLEKRYPKCRAALRWWCNDFCIDGKPSRFDISYKKYLKEFILSNPPTFAISANCCTYAKKKVAEQTSKEYEVQLNVTGVRKAEGGARATAYKNCYSRKTDEADQYRPLFWFTDADRQWYENAFQVVHSRCYTEYGLKRTGCTGCPFGLHLFEELAATQNAESSVVTAANHIFADSYAWTKQYKEFVKSKGD